MELREFAEQILFAETMEDKLLSVPVITDVRPGSAMKAPLAPGRPPELRFKTQTTGKANVPRVHRLDQPADRGRLLHFFANHELLATELMALVLLRFPDAPTAFRRGVLQTLKEEQEHTRLYLARMRACGVTFGQLPVSGYFWRCVSSMESPLDYVAGLSLTFEQANLDFARFFARAFSEVDDVESARLLERIYQDEIGHVAYGLNWFRKWKDPRRSDWEAFRQLMKFPLTAQRAKGPAFNSEARQAAGFDQQFIDELKVYAHSRGRTPSVFVFNPFAEGHIAQGKSFAPNRHQQLLQQDLQNLPQFLCRQDDVVLAEQAPSVGFLSTIKNAGYPVPEFVLVDGGKIDQSSNLLSRKLGKLSPWAWGPDSLELLAQLFPNVTGSNANSSDFYNETIAKLYSKEWSAELLRQVLNESCRGREPERTWLGSARPVSCVDSGNWLCAEWEVGLGAATVSEVMAAIEKIRQQGHHPIVIKKALGVAGHNAIRLLEPELLRTQRRWIDSALENGHRLVVEPWLDRVADFSVQFEMGAAGLKLIGFTGLLNDWRGQFQGNWACPGFDRHVCFDLRRFFAGTSDISRRVSNLYSKIRLMMQDELHKAGFRGPVGIDSFIYRTAQGECRLKPIVEINPRYTMGRLTLELMRNVVPGKVGTFRLINLKQAKAEGYADLADWARAASERRPIRLEGQPVPRISEGVLCLSDPERAQVCLAVFEVSEPC